MRSLYAFLFFFFFFFKQKTAYEIRVRDWSSDVCSSDLVPDRAVDAQSLIALADVVVSAGGTMNREAAALGVPVYTTYGGRLGGVDEELIREGRLRPLTDPRALDLHKRAGLEGARVRRDADLVLELLLSALWRSVSSRTAEPVRRG